MIFCPKYQPRMMILKLEKSLKTTYISLESCVTMFTHTENSFTLQNREINHVQHN